MRFLIISILAVLTGASYSQGQQPSQSNGVSYEGQNVAAVEIGAGPNISVESLRPLVQQKADEPYSTSKVQNTIGSIRATGRFTNVVVEVKPDAGGLHVTFTMEPAVYFGVFDFPGATKSFSYTRLL
jgi:outer membrane protein assembly factor BamA